MSEHQAKAIHSMIRVLDEARSVEFYKKAFGLEVADRYPFDGFTLIYLRNPQTEFEVELTVNNGREKPYDPGDGYGHLAVSVSDVESEYARFRAVGLKTTTDVKSLMHNGHVLGKFFFAEDPDGYKIEVLQRAGRFK
jgi:lactoylglutathione lyase